MGLKLKMSEKQNNRKFVRIIRFGQPKPLKAGNDYYDSVIEVWDEGGKKMLLEVPYVNTDFTDGYNGGILAEGNYRAIWQRRNNGKLAFFLFNWPFLTAVKSKDDIYGVRGTLGSLVPNRNHLDTRGRALSIMDGILIHVGGKNNDYSHGCITIHPDCWAEFEALWEEGDYIDIELVREACATVPFFYPEPTKSDYYTPVLPDEVEERR